jgi:RNA 2',3'-cyclic 3'-phosphodiesterase
VSAPAALRLFFALWPDAGQREALLAALRQLQLAPVGRSVPAGNLHVTLAFLGSVAPDRIPALREVAAARSWPTDLLMFDQLAWWPKARLLCLEARVVPAALVSSVETFHEDLRRAGFKVEHRAFRAHITVARNVPSPPAQVAALPIPPFGWPMRGVALVGSTPTPEGSRYQVLEQF